MIENQFKEYEMMWDFIKSMDMVEEYNLFKKAIYDEKND